ncbi:DEAD/DEAH box helicase family protein NDAI_0D05120, partial [Naumovozyma dairenensis CBS 421]
MVLWPILTYYTLNTYRQLVDSIRALSTYSVLYRYLNNGVIPGDSKADEIFFNHVSESWNWTKTMYQRLTTAYMDYNKFNVKVCQPDAVLISGKRFSRTYIQEFYTNMTARFDGNIDKLKHYFLKLWSVKHIADTLLNSGANSNFCESRAAPKDSLFLLFTEKQLSLQMPQTVPEVTLDTDVVTQIVSDMGVCVMWMIYFSATGPYRFPDMVILKYAGNNRNLFIDPETRCLEIITSYSKTRREEYLCKTLDKQTSDYLFYYIFVARAVLKHSMGENYDGMNKDLFQDTNTVAEQYLLRNYLSRSVGNGESEEDWDPVRYSKIVLNSFVFVDCVSHSLMNYSKFAAFMKLYPASISGTSRLSFREMRHGMIKLVREYVKVEGESFEVMNMKERLAGHSAATGQSVYANDVETGTGSDASLEEKYASLINSAWQNWLGLGYGKEREEGGSAVARNACVKKYFSTNGSIKDLFVAGKKLYGKEFRFREGQFDVAVEIYLSGTQIIPIQALPGFGKTALFQIPLVALSYGEQKTVSFVFVPYVCLLSNMKLRLSSCGINCGILKDLFVNGPAVEEKNLFCDVYVGTFNDLGSENFVRLVNNWYNIYQDCILGMIVIDEFHNLETEQSYRGQSFRLIPEINFNLAWKVVVMTGTAGEKGMVKPMKFIGYDKEMCTSMVSNKNRILYFDLVNQIPLKNIVKKFQAFERSTVAETEVEKLVDRFMEYDTKSKVIIVCKEKVTVEK